MDLQCLRADRADQDPALRVDRALLRAPVRQNDGSMRYEGVLAYADKPMRYATGMEVATEQALSDPAYHETLRGLSLITETLHKPGQPVDVQRDPAKVIGHVRGARWDKTERAVIVDLVVTDRQANADIAAKRITELSEAYVPVLGKVRADGAVEQLSRTTNHVALVEHGRNPGAGLRADEDDTMTPEQIAAAIKAGIAEGLRADSEQSASAKLTETTRKLEAETTRATKAEAALSGLRKTLGMRADSDDVAPALDALVAARVKADSDLLERARTLGVKLPASSGPSTRLKDLAVALGGDATRADSADYCEGVIAAARPKTAAERHANGTTFKPLPALNADADDTAPARRS